MKKLLVLFLLFSSLAWAGKDEVTYVDGKPVVVNPSTPDADMSHLRLQRHAPGWRLDQHHTRQGPAPTPAYAPIQGAEQIANVATFSISMASQHAPPPDFSGLHAQVQATQARIEKLDAQRRELEDLFNRYNTPEVIAEAKGIEEKVKAFQSQSSSDRIGLAHNKWMTKKIAEGNYGSLSTELDRELRTWSSYTHNKKSVLDLADKYKAQNDRIGNVSGDAKTYSEIALQSGIQNLTEAAEIEGGHLPGSFREKLGISESQLEIAKGLLDVGLSMTPGVSVGKDAYEALSGKSLIDGSKLDFTSRSLAVLGVATAGGSNVIKNSLKGLVKIAEASHARGLLGHGFESATKLTETIIDSAGKLAHTNPELGRKLDYVLGKATGSAHNIERSQEMLRQMERIGLPDHQGTRTFLADHLKQTLENPSSILKTQENGRVVRESLLAGPRGVVKVESIWEDAKLITVKIFGGGQ